LHFYSDLATARSVYGCCFLPNFLIDVGLALTKVVALKHWDFLLSISVGDNGNMRGRTMIRGKLIGTKSSLLLFFLPILLSFSVHAMDNAQSVSQIFDKLGLSCPVAQPGTDKITIVKTRVPQEVMPKKEWTIILYIAADNDLAPFSIRNIKQMAKVGSNEHFNIVVQLDIRKSDGEKITRRYCVQKGKVLYLNADDPHSQGMDSGDPNTLISCCDWAITNFPAKYFGLVFWDHGSGILDPQRCRAIRAEELFTFNQMTQRFELDRSIGYIDRMLQRGICFDDSTGNYLTNQKLDYALNVVCSELLGGNKFVFVGFDACLMQMLEVANLMKKYAHIMVGSQEAGLGYGWNYADVLEPFVHGSLEPKDFAKHIVKSYEKSYEKITADYTMSAINLDAIDELEENVHNVACILLKGLRAQKNGMVKKTIKSSRNKMVCTHFDEPSYIDLHHFYANLLSNLDYMKLKDSQGEAAFKGELASALLEGQEIVERTVFANSVGKKLFLARGISIYFPERFIHPSYLQTIFAAQNDWITLLRQYLIL